MLKPFVFTPILFFAQLSWSADFVCSLRTAPVGKITARFSSNMTEKCLSECAVDQKKQVEDQLTALRDNLRPLTTTPVDKLTAVQLVELYRKIYRSYALSSSNCMADELAGRSTREQTLKCLNKNKQSSRLEFAGRAVVKYQNAAIRSEWQDKFLSMGLSSKMACTIQLYELEYDVIKLVGGENTINERQKEAILDMISKRTEEPPPPLNKEEAAICKAYNSDKSIPIGFSNAIMQNCI